MTLHPTLRGLLLAVAALLVVAGCAGDPDDLDEVAEDEAEAEDDADDEPAQDVDDVDTDEDAITLVANPWPGSYANVGVAEVLLTEELGHDVEVVEIDEQAQWSGLDAGDLDAVLEVWPSGHEDNVETYIEGAETVVDLGELGVVGEIGWFTPGYVLDEHPDMATWEGLQGQEDVFATAETEPAGQFLAADPSFVQFDEEIIDNLGLDLEVVQSGSEAAQLTEVESAIADEEPILFYFYTPHWMHAEHELEMVELPEPTDECLEAPDAERDCGYPEDVLFKAASAELEERAPDAFAFLDAFEMSNEAQDEMTLRMEEDDVDHTEAAADWVDDNEDVWQEWLP